MTQLPFAAALGLLLWVVFSLLCNGIASLRLLTALRGLSLIVYGAGAGVILHGLVGWVIAAVPPLRWAFVLLLVGLTLASAVYVVRVKLLSELRATLPLATKVSLALWVLLLLGCLGLLHLRVRYTDPLPDGQYLSKEHNLNVKIQFLTGSPTDNYIPFAVAEYFLRGVSFKEQRPILPGNEVSNRTILMSLVAMPFRVACGVPRDHPQLGSYNFFGRKCPDVMKLNTGSYFEQFEIVGMVLNSLLLLGAILFCTSFGAEPIVAPAALLYITCPYFLAETIYTWPKALAGFFILLAWSSHRKGHHSAVVGALMALAYHSHPYAIVFAGFLGLFYLIQFWRGKSDFYATGAYLAIFALLVTPWFFWTRLILQIPSDLIAQNLSGPNTEIPLSSPVNFLWVRFWNFLSLIAPVMFRVYPFQFATVVAQFLYCLPGAVGLLIVYPAFAECALTPNLRPWIWFGLIGPGLALVAIFSCPALLVLHGYQSLAAALLFIGVWFFWQRTSRACYFTVLGLQLAINILVLLARGAVVGVH